MEDMARLALVEQNVRDISKFSEILYEVLRHIINILENPHDYELRTINNTILRKCIECKALGDYMRYVGYRQVAGTLTYPKESSLSQLRIAQATIERKLCFCTGTVDQTKTSIKAIECLPEKKKAVIVPAKILNTKNSFLLKIERLFNDVLKYEDEELQELARQKIPIVTLQLMAIDRVREQQKKIKTGKFKDKDLSYDIALLLELLGWFKNKFFKWVDSPTCRKCGGNTVLSNTSTLKTESETCRLEIYHCDVCDCDTVFPRYNDVRMLLRTRRGRCGEWANCFTLICRAMGYDTRYVYDVTDHVWCEVFDFDSNTWLHVDPCEAQINAPLTYSHGWGKKLTYVIGFSKDDLQDVTWRYTTNHKEVLKRRKVCDEEELLLSILALREHRQQQVSDARRKYLAKRNLQELAQLLVERKPEDYEKYGRTSGSLKWRQSRGEIGNGGHTFNMIIPGKCRVRYYPYQDKYRISGEAIKEEVINTWEAGVYNSSNMAKKIEMDWKMVYLAREEGEDYGSISWRLGTDKDHILKAISIRVASTVFETGHVDWYIKFNNEKSVRADLSASPTTFDRDFHFVVITAELSGGRGSVAWQHAQLFRSTFDPKTIGFDMQIHVAKK